MSDVGFAGVTGFAYTTTATAVRTMGVAGVGSASAVAQGPSLILNFAGSTTLDPRITFTRASSGTYFDSAGVLRSATYNLLAYSEQFDNAAWSKTNLTATAAAVISPAGTLTGSRLTEDTSGSAKYAISSQTAMTSGTTYVASFFAKNNGRVLQITFQGASHGISQYANFDLSNGTVTASAGGTAAISSVGNGWYRCSFASAATSSVTAGAAAALASSTTAPRLENYTGDGTSGIFIWGAQLEAASTAGPYYATTTAANGAPRLTFNPTTLAPQGLLVEEQRTNLITYSEQFDNAAWSKGNSTITANAITAPDGTLTADKIVENTANASHDAASSVFTATAGATYTTSVFVKAAERGFAWVRLFQNTSPFAFVGYTVNLSTGATAALTFTSTVWTAPSVSVQSVGNGWWRVSVTGTIASADNIRIVVAPALNASTGSYVGDGTSGIYAWGAQLEAGAFPTSYIPTVASQATRAADSASMTGTNFSSWYNATEGTLYAQAAPISPTTNASNQILLSFDDGTTNNRLQLYRVSSGGNYGALVSVSGVVGYNPTVTGAWAVNSSNAIALAYAASDQEFAYQGSLEAGFGTGSVPTVNRAQIGVRADGFLQWNGTIARIAFYPRRLTDVELQGITA